MRITGLLAFSLLAVTILSYGMVAPGHAQSDDDAKDPRKQLLPTAEFDLGTDRDLYANGQVVKVTGKIPNYTDLAQKQIITFQIFHMIEATDTAKVRIDRVGIGQVTPMDDGSFAFSFNAGGTLWKANGDYHIVAYSGGQSRDVAVIEFTGANTDLFSDTPDPVEPVNPEPVDTPPEPVEPPIDSTPPIPPPPPQPPKLPPPPPPPPPQADPEPPVCGPGTEMVDGVCQVIAAPDPEPPATDGNGGCLIATAVYGTELAPQVQLLREVRDNTLMSTSSGMSFMTGFNQVYYAFSPAVADLERENPAFRDMVRTAITPMISTLSIMTLADPGSEEQVLGLGISVIVLNLAMYVAAPALVGLGAYRYVCSKRDGTTVAA